MNNNLCFCIDVLHSSENFKLNYENDVYSIYGDINKNNTVLIKYHGYLIPNNELDSKKIFINYGYGNFWAEKDVKEMNMCKNSEKASYCLLLDLANAETFNFCFMDSSNNWDLNENTSYHFNIDESLTSISKTELNNSLLKKDNHYSLNSFLSIISKSLFNWFGDIGNYFYNLIKY